METRREDRRWYRWSTWRPWYRRNRVETWGILLILIIVIVAIVLAHALRPENRTETVTVHVSSEQLKTLSAAYAAEVAKLSTRLDMLERRTATSEDVAKLSEAVKNLAGTVSNQNLMLQSILDCSCAKKAPPHAVRKAPPRHPAKQPKETVPLLRQPPPIAPPVHSPAPPIPPAPEATVIHERMPIGEVPKTVCVKAHTEGRSTCNE